MLTDFDLDVEVDIEHRALGRQKMNLVFKSTLFNVFYADMLICKHREATDC